MNSYSKSTITTEVISIMEQYDIRMRTLEEIVDDAQIHRFRLIDEGGGKKSGWYVVNNGFLTFGSWKGEKYTVKLNRGCQFPSIDNADYYLRRREQKERRVYEREQAALSARSIWENAEECLSHPYLSKKRVGSYGVRVDYQNLLVPIINNDGQLRSIQFINEFGQKWFLKNGEIKGGFLAIGSPKQSLEIMVSEGYSTAATLFEVTKIPQIVAFNAGNLLAVARNIRTKFPDSIITIASDNDSNNHKNIGISKGKEAARTVDASLIFPKFKTGDKGTDFNDYANLYGREALAKAFEIKGAS